MYEYYKTKQGMLETIDSLSRIIDLLLKDTINCENVSKGTLDAMCYFYDRKETLVSILKSETIGMCNVLDTKDQIIQKYVRYYVDNEIDFIKGDNDEK